jgi:transcriptional regulator GlxA family with amidase domain
MLAFPDVQVLDVVGPLEVFGRTTRLLRESGYGSRRPVSAYELEIVAPNAGEVRSSSGLGLVAERTFGKVIDGVDTLLIAGGAGVVPLLDDRSAVAWVCKMAQRVRRIGSVCTGAFLLAEAGLLDGRPCTTHWAYCRALAERYPKARVESDPIFIKEGNVYTSAGVTAGMDLALAMVEEDHGRAISLEVARQLVMFVRRPGGQSQFSAQLSAQLSAMEPIREIQTWILEHLDEDLSVERLAKRAAMSPRNFARVFLRETKTTPGRYVHAARIEAARRLLEDGSDSIEVVARQCGFGARESMRRTFMQALNTSPSTYRERFTTRKRATT